MQNHAGEHHFYSYSLYGNQPSPLSFFLNHLRTFAMIRRRNLSGNDPWHIMCKEEVNLLVMEEFIYYKGKWLPLPLFHTLLHKLYRRHFNRHYWKWWSKTIYLAATKKYLYFCCRKLTSLQTEKLFPFRGKYNSLYSITHRKLRDQRISCYFC